MEVEVVSNFRSDKLHFHIKVLKEMICGFSYYLSEHLGFTAEEMFIKTAFYKVSLIV